MKKLIAFSLILSVIISCKKIENSNPLSDYSNFKQGAYITLDSILNTEFNFAQLATSQVGIEVKKYPNGVKIDSVILYVTDTATTDKSKWKFVKALAFDVDSINLTCTGAQLATALNKKLDSFAPGTQYYFYNRIVTNEGLSYDITNIGSTLENGAAYNISFRWTTFIVCPFKFDEIFPAGATTANFNVVDDKIWQDWSVGDIVKVKKAKENTDTAWLNMESVYPNPDYGDIIKPWYVKVLKKNGQAFVDATLFANYGGSFSKTSICGMTQTGPTLNTVGFVFSCTGYLGIRVGIWNKDLTGLAFSGFGVPPYGPFNLLLQK